jgi:hypothetical protein
VIAFNKLRSNAIPSGLFVIIVIINDLNNIELLNLATCYQIQFVNLFITKLLTNRAIFVNDHHRFDALRLMLITFLAQ